jgi:hypothetical protein
MSIENERRKGREATEKRRAIAEDEEEMTD